MTFTILISCMHQDNHDILQRSNIQSDCVVVNQCDIDKIEDFDFVNKFGEPKHCRFIYTTERGLSRSRNMAIANAPAGAVCLLCDDDEILEDNVAETITNAFEQHPKSAAILFYLIRKDLEKQKDYPLKEQHLGFRQILHSNSIQMAFQKDFIIKHNIEFDEKMGSGTGNGGGEENKFLIDLRRAKGNLWYSPKCIATVLPGQSQWHHGYDEHFLQNQGWASRRIMGAFLSMGHLFIWGIKNHFRYCANMSMFRAYLNLYRGFFQKR